MGASQARAAKQLTGILRDSKWDRIIGTSLDADTRGANYKVTYAWKIKDRVIETTTKERNQESVALMRVNAKTGAVFHMSVDSLGSSAIGEWKVDDNGDAVPEMVYTGPDNREGLLIIRYHFERGHNDHDGRAATAY